MSDAERLGDTLSPLYHVEHEIGPTTAGLALQGLTSDGIACRLMILPEKIRSAMTDPSRFTREMEHAGRVAGEGLLQSLGAGVPTTEVAYFAFEDPRAPSARETLERGVILSAPDIATVGRTLAAILGRVHAEGLVHGLVTPDLVFLPPDGGARLAGVGMYQGLLAAGAAPAVVTDMLELEHYLSPEQLAGSSPDVRTDVFLLGVTLYELLTGRPPFGGRTTSTVMVSVLADEPPNTARGRVRAPGRTVSAILRAIEKDPRDRWANMSSFSEALLETPSKQQLAVTPATGMRSGCLPVILLCLAVSATLMLV